MRGGRWGRLHVARQPPLVAELLGFRERTSEDNDEISQRDHCLCWRCSSALPQVHTSTQERIAKIAKERCGHVRARQTIFQKYCRCLCHPLGNCSKDVQTGEGLFSAMVLLKPLSGVVSLVNIYIYIYIYIYTHNIAIYIYICIYSAVCIYIYIIIYIYIYMHNVISLSLSLSLSLSIYIYIYICLFTYV